MTALAPTLQSFFQGYLVGQRAASRHTICAYRDTFCLLLRFAQEGTGTKANDLDLATIDAELVADFLVMLEERRGNAVSTRNARLAAIHSLFAYSALRHPEHAEVIARVLAIPFKNGQQTVVSYLSDTEVEALLASPDRSTWSGRRDYVMLLVLVTTGLRVSELTALTRGDIFLQRPGARIACHGKRRKDRIMPVDPVTASALRTWLAENPGSPEAHVFTAHGTTRKLSTDAVAQRVKVHTETASRSCLTLAKKHVTPHSLRHTCAMRWQAQGVGAPTIALCLGHESLASTRPYLHADLDLKQRALDRTAPPKTKKGRYHPPDALLGYLESL